MKSRIVAAVALVCSTLAVCSSALAQAGGSEHWVGTWATAVVARAPQAQAPSGQGAQAPAAVSGFSHQTLRQIVRVSLGGDRVRVILSNAFGTAPLPVGAARVALRDKGAAIVPKSDRALTFSGQPSAAIAPGAVVVSDPVSLSVPPLGELAIDLYLPEGAAGPQSTLTTHGGALQTNYLSPPGNHTGALDMPVLRTTENWFFLARVEVAASDRRAVVALGDSITDGTRSTPNTNNRWPDHFARRLAAQQIRMGVLNAGIGGNQVLSDYNPGVSALARLDRDVLMQTGVTHVIVMEGINDIRRWKEVGRSTAPTAADLIGGHLQIVARARARGVKIYGATLTPCEGNSFCTPEMEATRQALNTWIRTSGTYDGVIDFDAAVRDPGRPARLLPRYDSGDNIHPNDAGYEAMGNAIDLEPFKAGQGASVTSR